MMDEDFILLTRRKDAQPAVSWLRVLSSDLPHNWELVRNLWNDSFCTAEDLPAATIKRWNLYAEAAEVPLFFKSDGCVDLI
ncbi:MAG: hypothetical protein HC816_21835 [Leptolyngbyaceae cyanobacterium RM1_1_2]|nr:hypothetical protein [Leptolyngbyaceae cyanobacterium RM1_1_2]